MRLYFLLIAALAFLLLATIWEAAQLEETKALFWFSADVGAALLRELGFACGIAYLIIISVEASSRKRQVKLARVFLEEEEERTRELRKELKKDVFSAVFARQIPQVLVDAVVEQVLSTEIVRLDYQNHLQLVELEGDDEQLERGYICLKTNAEYKILNVSNRVIKVPIRIGFPTPGPQALKKIFEISISDVRRRGTDRHRNGSW